MIHEIRIQVQIETDDYNLTADDSVMDLVHDLIRGQADWPGEVNCGY